jgi:hypothetical protein
MSDQGTHKTMVANKHRRFPRKFKRLMGSSLENALPYLKIPTSIRRGLKPALQGNLL